MRWVTWLDPTHSEKREKKVSRKLFCTLCSRCKVWTFSNLHAPVNNSCTISCSREKIYLLSSPTRTSLAQCVCSFLFNNNDDLHFLCSHTPTGSQLFEGLMSMSLFWNKINKGHLVGVQRLKISHASFMMDVVQCSLYCLLFLESKHFSSNIFLLSTFSYM